jgi:HEAT repeat protein
MFALTALLCALFSFVLSPLQEGDKSQETTQSTSQEREATQQPASTSSAPASTAASEAGSQARSLKEQAWEVLQNGVAADNKQDRAAAVHATGLIRNNSRARKIAESALQDDAPEVRAAGAAALGDMQSRRSIPKLKSATDDKDPSAALAAAHSLLELNDDSGYGVYYEVLTGERKTGKGTLAQAAALKDPKKLAELGFQQTLGFIPFGGLGWRAFKMVKKDDSSPARAAAATVLAKDLDPKTTKALIDATGDKNWIIRAAALEALARRGNSSVLDTVELYLADEEGEVKYTAAATALRLIGIKESKSRKSSQTK